MKRSHEQIEQLLGQRPETGTLSEGFAGRVSEGVHGVSPGALPVAGAVMPASVKGAIMLGAVGVVSAGIWIASTSGPAPDPSVIDTPEIAIEPESDGWLEDFNEKFDEFKDEQEKRAELDLFSEGRQMLADARRVGQVFLSVIPSGWTEMIFGDGMFSTGTVAPPSTTTDQSDSLQG